MMNEEVGEFYVILVMLNILLFGSHLRIHLLGGLKRERRKEEEVEGA